MEVKIKGQHAGELTAMRQRIAELESSEARLRESEKKLRELADLLPQVVFEMNAQGTLTFVNRNAFKAFGYTLSDFGNGLNALHMFVPEDRNRLEENIQRILGGEELGINEYTAQRKDGSRFPVLIHSSPIIRDNKPAGLRGIVIAPNTDALRPLPGQMRTHNMRDWRKSMGSFNLLRCNYEIHYQDHPNHIQGNTHHKRLRLFPKMAPSRSHN